MSSWRYQIGVLLAFLSFSSFAETTLYACTRNGETTLESVKSKDCDTLKEYRYPTFSREEEHGKREPLSDHRPEEVRALQAINSPYDKKSRQRRYERVDDRIGWTMTQDYENSLQDKCHFFQAILNHALSYIDAKNKQKIEIGPTDSAALQTQIHYAKTQVNYYCP